MTRLPRIFYGWQSDGDYRVSRHPPDDPVRPSIAFESAADAEAWVKQKRAQLMWIPALEKRAHAAA